MNLTQAILLGILQGLTEFIPISSSGHLILAEKLMGLDQRMSAQQITAFIAVMQLGTLLASKCHALDSHQTINAGKAITSRLPACRFARPHAAWTRFRPASLRWAVMSPPRYGRVVGQIL